MDKWGIKRRLKDSYTATANLVKVKTCKNKNKNYYNAIAYLVSFLISPP